jgi:heme A synthase
VSDGSTDDRTWREPPEDPVGFDGGKVRDVRARDLAIRFAFGAGASLIAGLVSLAAGARAGGLFLAFPAILAASLTLIADEESRRRAREDARGAVVGALGLAAFAAVGALAFEHAVPASVLVLATAAWALVAVAGYFALWGRRRKRSGVG